MLKRWPKFDRRKLGLLPVAIGLCSTVAILVWLEGRAEEASSQEIEISLNSPQPGGQAVDWELMLAAGSIVGGVLLWADNRLDSLEAKTALLEQRCLNLQDQIATLKSESERHDNRLYKAVSQITAAQQSHGFHPRSTLTNGEPWPTDDPPTVIPIPPYDRPPTPPPAPPSKAP